MTEPLEEALPGSPADPADPAAPSAAPAAATPPAGASDATPASIELAPGYELPTARQVVGRGLQLAYDSTRDIRRASLYIGLLFLAVLGPIALLFVVDLPRLGDLTSFSRDTLATDPAALEASRLLVPLVFGAFAAFLGAIAVSFDGQLLVVALLASRAIGRPLTLRESLQRGRQVFWRYAFAAFVVGAISAGVSWAIGYGMGTIGQPRAFGASLLSTLVAAIVNLPFGYILAATVIGDVNGAVALSRSIVLVRARPRLALAVGAFAFLSSAIQTFGLGAALDVAAEVGQVLHLDLDPSGSGLVLLAPLLAVALVALGSLTVTVGAIAAAPQVAAFLGLTHYAGGLDRARIVAPAPEIEATSATEPGTPADPTMPPAERLAAEASAWATSAGRPASRTRWITRPMLASIVVSAIVAGSGLLAAATAGPPSGSGAGHPSSTLVALLQGLVGPARLVVLDGHDVRVEHPARGSIGDAGSYPAIAGAEYAYLDHVPEWLVREVFACGTVDVACSRDGSPEGAFDQGAILFVQDMAGRPVRSSPDFVAELGPELFLAGYDGAPYSAARYPGASHAVLTYMTGGEQYVHYIAWDRTSFQEYRTYARSRWAGNTLLTLIPIRDELLSTPVAWDVAASYVRSHGQPEVTDSLRRPETGALLPYVFPPALEFLVPTSPPA